MPTGRVNSPEMYATAEYIAGCDKEECDRQSERAALDLSGANGYRYRSDERSVANYRADSISVGNLARVR